MGFNTMVIKFVEVEAIKGLFKLIQFSLISSESCFRIFLSEKEIISVLFVIFLFEK